MGRELLIKKPIPFWRLEVEGLVVGPVMTDGRYIMPGDHAHQHYEVVFNYSSIPVRHSVCGQFHETNGTYILWRAPYVLHSVRTLTDEPYIRQQISFPPFVMNECCQICDIGRLRTLRACTIPVTEQQLSVLRELIRHLRYLWEQKVSEKARYGLMAALLYEISELLPADLPAEEPMDSYIQEMMIYIVEHAEADLSLEALASRFFVSKSKLAADFQKITQQTLHDYVCAIRLYRAKILLAKDLPLSVIADQCGFSRDSSFIRMFQRETGMTPGEYRQAIKR